MGKSNEIIEIGKSDLEKVTNIISYAKTNKIRYEKPKKGFISITIESIQYIMDEEVFYPIWNNS